MKKSSWICIGIFLISLGVFGVYNVKAFISRDNLGPVIQMEADEIYISVNDGNDVLLQGVTATDSKDGDVTDSLVVESISEFVSENERYVNYAAFDSNNHVTKTYRKLIYTDYTPIRFSLSAPMSFSSTASAQDVLDVVQAIDCMDGDISDKINFTEGSKITMLQPSDYPVVLEVTNSAGDTQELPVTVTIYKASEQSLLPQISLTDYLVYTKVGQVLDPKVFLESVTYHDIDYTIVDGTGTFATSETGIGAAERENPTVSYDQFAIYDKVDYQTPGVYEIQYTLDDKDSNRGKVNLVVVVEEE